MAERVEGGYEDALEEELFEIEAFLHRKGLSKQLELWRKSADYNDDLKDYERFIAQEAERMDSENSDGKDSS